MITVLHGKPVETGKRYRFDYPLEFESLADYSAHRGQTVTVLGLDAGADPIIDDNGDGDQVMDLMFKVRANDGWEGFAWHSELEECPDPRDPDYSRPGVFATHNCWKCKDGKEPCIKGSPRNCENLHARND